MEDEISLIEVCQVLQKRKRIILQILCGIILLSLIFTFLQPKIYQATTTLLPPVEEKMSIGSYAQLAGAMEITLPNGSRDELDYPSLLKSRNIAQKAVQEFDLYPKERNLQKRIDALLRAVKVEDDLKSNLITIKIEYPEANKVAAIANKYPIYLNDYILHNNVTQAKLNRIFIEGRLRETKKAMEKAENQLKNYQINSGLIVLEEQSKKTIENIATIKSELTETQAELASIRANLKQARKQLSGQAKMQLSGTSFSANPVVEQLKKQLVENETDMAGLLKKYTENHPDVLAKKAIIQKIEEKLSGEVTKSYSGESYEVNPSFQALKSSLLESQVKAFALQAKEDALENVLSATNKDISTLPNKGLNFIRLQREVELQNQLYVMLMQQYEQAKISEVKTLPIVQVLDKAYVPDKPSKPLVILNIALAVMIGLCLGAFAAFFLEFLEKGKTELGSKAT